LTPLPLLSRRKNILFLTHRAPYPPNRGDRIRSYHILRYLAKDYRVYLGSLIDEPVSQLGQEVLNQLTLKRALVPVSPRLRWANAAWSFTCGNSATEGLFASRRLRERVRSWAQRVEFHAVIAFCSSMVQFAAVPELVHVPLIVDLVDVDSQKWLDYAAASGGYKKWLYELEAARVRRLECSLPSRVKAITLVSEAEADIYRDFCRNNKSHAVPNGVDLSYFCPHFPVEAPRPNQCVFVGVLDYRPNIDGLCWFCEQVWPDVLRHKPDAVLAIVGRNPAPAVRRLGSQPGVRLVGEVGDVRPFVAESRFSVAPLRIARGVQNKLLESMAMGKPVLATPQALEGLRVDSGSDVLVAGTPQDFAQAACDLYRDEKLCRRLADRGREYVCTHHNWEKCLLPFTHLLNEPWGLPGHQIITQPATFDKRSRRVEEVSNRSATPRCDQEIRRGVAMPDR
jgi:sugar transferase (PEP-CTERM/EpsH1 system associated)